MKWNDVNNGGKDKQNKTDANIWKINNKQKQKNEKQIEKKNLLVLIVIDLLSDLFVTCRSLFYQTNSVVTVEQSHPAFITNSSVTTYT